MHCQPKNLRTQAQLKALVQICLQDEPSGKYIIGLLKDHHVHPDNSCGAHPSPLVYILKPGINKADTKVKWHESLADYPVFTMNPNSFPSTGEYKLVDDHTNLVGSAYYYDHEKPISANDLLSL